ncbi:hypothetical protein [Halanaerobacter jeridensis]|uniref:Uncharacterized protein n=1 Tax=Halanaerobacter jeridensis TaxID=706427 RepID=A0A939BP14_9FIRM|nr:hypothetical protein [Halanaerobacter jeridensis]MBM7556372.1 hypothetical protein [Halanaerobacter jeridensis]
MFKVKSIIILVLLSIIIVSPVEAAKEAVIIYSLEFIEMRSEIEKSLNIEFNEQKSGAKEWQVINNQDWLNYIHNVEKKNFFMLRGGGKEEQSRLHYNAWLTTINRKQAAIEFTERLINWEENNYSDDQRTQFKFEIKPLLINQQQNKIMTNIKFKHCSVEGNKSKLEMNSAITTIKEQPITILRQKVTKNNNSSYRYFVLYLTASIVNPDAIEDNSLIAIGNMKDINSLFASREDKSQLKENKIALYLAKKAEKMKYNYVNNKFQCKIELAHENEEFIYSGDFSYNLSEQRGLFLVGRIDNRIEQQLEAGAALGFGDRIQWTKNLAFEVIYFPVLEGVKEDINKDSILEAKLELDTTDWNIWYSNTKIDDDYFNRAAISYYFNPSWGLVAEWEENYNTDGKIYLGTIFNFNE